MSKKCASRSASPKVFLGMSGGVDSSVSALLLKDQGYAVTGVYMKNWSKDLPGMKCPWAEDLADAKRVAVQLDLDFEVWDFEADYKRAVVDYMLAEFQAGRTPNPDVICNELIKFKLFTDRAFARGADFVATGHYARVVAEDSFAAIAGHSSGVVAEHSSAAIAGHSSGVTAEHPSGAILQRAVDENKDQTYFLYRMSDAALARTIFPVGGLTKPEVKRLAAEHGLDVAHKKESMGICFVGEVGMKDFLQAYLSTTPGEIREQETDRVLGYHDGALLYTIGQRHGLYLGGGLPYYVVGKDLVKNLVYVSRDLNHPALWATELALTDLHLRNGLTLAELVQTPHVTVRLRHRGELLPARIASLEAAAVDSSSAGPPATAADSSSAGPSAPAADSPATAADSSSAGPSAAVIFSAPVKRPASGQSVVFYAGDHCLGGGIVA